ncbi:hypothetical protein KC332_g17 [Hortaea werneckii]|nr:hypothetical protein KC332_g17 [Hortaea werneckii]
MELRYRLWGRRVEDALVSRYTRHCSPTWAVLDSIQDEAHYLVHHRRNVNGIRNPFGYQPWNAARTFPAMFDILGSDIVVMQELKIQRKDLRDDMVMIDGWDCYFSLPRHKKGYSGVGVYTRNATCAPIKAEEGLLGVLPSALGQPYCELPEAQRIGGYPSEQQKDGAVFACEQQRRKTSGPCRRPECVT